MSWMCKCKIGCHTSHVLIGVDNWLCVSLPWYSKLFGPVRSTGPQYPTQPPTKEIHQVLPPASVKWRYVNTSPASWLEMSVSARIHPLVGGHGQHNDLVQLTDCQTGHPHTMEHTHSHHHHHPGTAQTRRLQIVDVTSVWGVHTGQGQVTIASPGGEHSQKWQEQ